MQKPSIKLCSRCKQEFICKSSKIEECECSLVKLTKQEQKFIKDKNFLDCVCVNCLLELIQECNLLDKNNNA